MSSYFSTNYLSGLLTSTTSRYNNLRRTLLSDESDGDTEDDSHISRVLRAYYIEKGRPFPPWLPPDPRSAPQQPPPMMQQYGQHARPPASTGTGRRAGGLSDLWDSPAQPTQPAQPASLRAGGPRPMAGGLQRRQPAVSSESYNSVSSRGSYGPGSEDLQPVPSGGSAQERLKARLYGGRNNSAGGSQGQQRPGGY